jgi:hypothetical protein
LSSSEDRAALGGPVGAATAEKPDNAEETEVIELRNKSEESDAYATTSTETAGHDHHSQATRSKYENSHTQKDPGREEAMEIKSPKRKPQKQRE